jgi:hypothetical protein
MRLSNFAPTLAPIPTPAEAAALTFTAANAPTPAQAPNLSLDPATASMPVPALANPNVPFYVLSVAPFIDKRSVFFQRFPKSLQELYHLT